MLRLSNSSIRVTRALAIRTSTVCAPHDAAHSTQYAPCQQHNTSALLLVRRDVSSVGMEERSCSIGRLACAAFTPSPSLSASFASFASVRFAASRRTMSTSAAGGVDAGGSSSTVSPLAATAGGGSNDAALGAAEVAQLVGRGSSLCFWALPLGWREVECLLLISFVWWLC